MATEDKRIDQLPAVTALDLTSLMAMQQGTNAKKVSLQQLVEYLTGQIEGENAVLYIEQTLNEEQQRQARLNIRCGSVGEVNGNCKARGNYSHAEGSATTASGADSHAEGYETTASGDRSHAEGSGTAASGSRSHAEGTGTTASGYSSHAEGSYTIASGDKSHAEGSGTRALGAYSHAEGYETTASGAVSHAEGYHTITSGKGQHVQGRYNVEDTEAIGDDYSKYAHIVGNGTANNARSNAHTLDWEGVPWYAGDRIMLGGTGMDDENAAALQPVFVPQNLTDAQKAQARENIGAAAAGAGGGTVTDAVTYTPQTLTAAQKLQARANIAAQETLTVENLKDQIVINYPDKITKQFTSFVKYGRICIFTVQLIVNTAVSDNYGFIVATLPKATVDRIWINNGTQFFIEVGSNGIRRNGEGLAAGNYMLSGFYLAVE